LHSLGVSSLLLPKLAETRGRVVVTSSFAHRTANIDWDDLHAERTYERAKRYGASKLANALFFVELDRRLRAAGVPVTAVGCPSRLRSDRFGALHGAPSVPEPAVGAGANVLSFGRVQNAEGIAAVLA